MNRANAGLATLCVADLVLDPFSYRDAFSAPAHQELLGADEARRLAEVLPVAIAQLDAVGDLYGALILSGLRAQLGQPPARA